MMVRPPCCDKQNVKRGLWSAEEDAKILAYVSKHGTGNWAAAPKKAGSFEGLRRCGKSCRLRWTNYLRPDLKHDNFTPQEEELIVRLHAAIGSRWSIIAQQLPGRTDNDVKNYWNTKLRKKLAEMGIDPVTHKPFSQILADYGNIGGLLKSGNRIGSLSRDLKNAFNAKPEQYSCEAEAISNINNHLMTGAVPPKAEPIQECFLNTTNFNSETCYSQSLDLLDQLQAIKLLTEASSCGKCETNSPHFHNDSPLSSTTSSSSSTCSTAAQEKSAAEFSWRDFLLEDVFLPIDQQDQQNVEFSSKDFTDQTQNGKLRCQDVMIPQGHFNCEGPMTTSHARGNGDLAIPGNNNFDQVPSSSSSSFVAGILDQENKIFLDFPGLLEEPLHF